MAEFKALMDLPSLCSIEFFLNTAENYKVRADRQHSQVAGHAKDNVMGDPAFSSAFNNFRTLLERFANGQSMQPIFDATECVVILLSVTCSTPMY